MVSAKVVATYSMGGSSKQSGTISGATLCLVWIGPKLFVFFFFTVVCIQTPWIRRSPDFCQSDPVPGCLSCVSILIYC